MILLLAILAGLLTGLAAARGQRHAYHLPPLRLVWLALLAFVPQLFAFYLPLTRSRIPDLLAAASLITSQILLLVFAWVNRKSAGMWVLISGLALNLAVIIANGGFMPISPQTAGHLLPAGIVQSLQLGSRFGAGKDILLLPENTRLVWLSDCFLLPGWFHYQVAFSLGDILIASGIFWLLVRQGMPLKMLERNKSHVINSNPEDLLVRNRNSDQSY